MPAALRIGSCILVAASVVMTANVTAASAQSGIRNMGPVINSAARDAEPTFTADGRTMYFNCFDRAPTPGSDICVSTLRNGEWSEPEVVGAPISTPEYMRWNRFSLPTAISSTS